MKSSLVRKKPLKRKAPLRTQRNKKPWGRRKKPLKRTPLRQVSQKQKTRLAEYYPRQRAFLTLHPWCHICIARDKLKMPRRSTEVHHGHYRSGKWLMDERYWIASCRACRMWPHDNSKEARKLGLLV